MHGFSQHETFREASAAVKDMGRKRRGSETTVFDIYWPLAALSGTLQERPLKKEPARNPTHTFKRAFSYT